MVAIKRYSLLGEHGCWISEKIAVERVYFCVGYWKVCEIGLVMK